jgi:hypothetical protein
LLSITNNTSFKAAGNAIISKVLGTHDIFRIIQAFLLLLSTHWFIKGRDSSGAAAINSYRVSIHFNQWSSAHPVLNEINNLGAVKVVCANESISIDHSIWRVFTNEHIFVEVGDRKMTFAMMLDCCNKSAFDEATVELVFIRTLLSAEQKEF